VSRWQSAGTALASGLLLGFLAFWLFVPVVRPEAPSSTLLLDRDGRLLGAALAADEQWRFPLDGAVPERYAVAVMAFEDRRFRHHPGVDPFALGRAVVANLREGRVVSGASTLTMQTVRIARENPPRTVPEKLWEMVLALRLELAHSKDDILLAYATHAPFGGNTVGVEAAAWRYYQRPAEELSWAEAATLAVLPNSPALIHPGRNRDALRAKRDRLLDTLVEQGHLPADDAELAKLEPLPGAPRPFPRLAPHLLHQAHQAGPGRHPTTLDGRMQARATDIVWRHHRGLAASEIHNVAVVVVDVHSGDVLAYVGNVPDFPAAPHDNHVDIVQAPRSTGSTLKPFLYADLLEAGEMLPQELVPDIPLRLGGFTPENFDRAWEGATPADEALARSRNVPATWELRQFGVDRFYDRLQRRGMTTLHRPAADYGLSLILGGSEGTLWELTAMYRDLAWAGLGRTEAPPDVHWRQGEPVARQVRLSDPAAAWLTLQALEHVARPGVHAGWRQFGSGRHVSWKTGTSFGFRDAWAVGVTPRVAVGVWVGNADGEGRPELIGVRAAAPVLFDLFDLVEADAGVPFPRPSAVVEATVCAHSGQRAGPDCPSTHVVDVPEAALGAPPCGHCQRIHVDEDGLRAHAACADVRSLTAVSRFSLPASQEVFFAPRHSSYQALPPWAPGCAPADEARLPLSLVSPRPRSRIVVPIDLDGQRGRFVMKAAHRDDDATLYWHLDGRYIGPTHRHHEVEVAPDPGEHEVVVVDAEGAQVARRFEVLPGR